LNCDEPDIREQLTNKTSTELINYLHPHTLVIIDEAQRVRNIGLTLKLIADNAPQIQIIATGSSSFDLSNQIAESLTGRSFEFQLFPISISELLTIKNQVETQRLLSNYLIYGLYPEVVTTPHQTETLLNNLVKNYLYKDALQYQGIKNPEIIEKLLQALALQIGNEVSFTELGNLLGIDKKTVSHYIRLLELAFIIFKLKPFSRNLRKEIGKLHKIYFWDLGIRNAILRNFNPLNLRSDIGQLWENFIITERIKYRTNLNSPANVFFWRTWSKQKIDLIEEVSGQLSAFEIKWTGKKLKIPSLWAKNYPQAKWQIINQTNYLPFLTSPLF